MFTFEVLKLLQTDNKVICEIVGHMFEIPAISRVLLCLLEGIIDQKRKYLILYFTPPVKLSKSIYCFNRDDLY